ncbi:unnamed protein product [Euphydryas editha]|uniref:Uncharacterized protein n=1 Tax=Euphydryas editha TaxID=104508 RepID=A0AAU9UA15_EUPED|nr:unnamed protein product [Euphydryas editha]
MHLQFTYDESGCEADMLEGAEGGRHSPPRPQQEPINLKNEKGDINDVKRRTGVRPGSHFSVKWVDNAANFKGIRSV